MLSVRVRPDLLLMTVVGEVDIVTMETWTEALAADLPVTTVLDVSGVASLSAAGLRALVGAFDRAAVEQRHFRLVAANRGIAQLLRMTEIDLRVPVYRSLSAALLEARPV